MVKVIAFPRKRWRRVPEDTQWPRRSCADTAEERDLINNVGTEQMECRGVVLSNVQGCGQVSTCDDGNFTCAKGWAKLDTRYLQA